MQVPFTDETFYSPLVSKDGTFAKKLNDLDVYSLYKSGYGAVGFSTDIWVYNRNMEKFKENAAVSLGV